MHERQRWWSGSKCTRRESLGQAASILNGMLALEPYELDVQPYEASKLSADLDFVDVRGQEAVKRAITIACAGEP